MDRKASSNPDLHLNRATVRPVGGAHLQVKYKEQTGPAEMAGRLRALAAPTEDLVWCLASTRAVLTSVLGNPSIPMAHTHAYRQNTYKVKCLKKRQPSFSF